MPKATTLLIVLAPLAFAGCTDGSSDFLDKLSGDDHEIRFRCDNDRSFRVSFNDDRDRATVEADDNTYRLRLVDRDGDRRQYGEDEVRLTMDGDEARLRIADERDYSGCEET